METPEGKYIPLEYKRGRPKVKEMDTVQLCAQAFCLEEMTGKNIEEGFIYYFRIKKRLHVNIDKPLRDLTEQTVRGIRTMMESGRTPPPEYSKRCESCSLEEQCLPEAVGKKKSVKKYIVKMLADDISKVNIGG